jgi:acyl-coenzyme A synthetase/AMP-(fatty) acid ligase
MKSLVNWSSTERTALFTDLGEAVTYGQLYKEVLLNSKLFKKKELLFIIGRNDLVTLKIYLAALEAGVVPLFLGADLSEPSLISLIEAYSPSKLFLPKEKYNSSNGFKIENEFEGYFICSNQIGLSPDLNSKLALLLTTSGSTGSPKLVRFTAENIISNVDSIINYLSIDSNECAVTTLPFNYSYGMSVINSHLRAGASLLLTDRSFFDNEFWGLMKSCGVTSLAGVPYSYEMLMKLRFERMDLPKLRTLTQAGGKMAPAQIKRVMELCKAKGMRFFTMYGQTEASPRMAFLSTEYLDTKFGSIGKPIPGGRLWLENEQNEEINEVDQIGELIYGGPNVALGYAKRKQDLLCGDDWNGVLRTGDLARQDAEGFFFIEGRKSRFLKIFGVRVSLTSVESWFQQKGFSAAAYGRDDFLMVTIEGGEEIQIAGLIKELSEVIQVHLSALNIAVLPKLPRLSSGKVDYQCLINHH